MVSSNIEVTLRIIIVIRTLVLYVMMVALKPTILVSKQDFITE